MNTTARIIEVERQGGTLVVTPQRDLRELDFQVVQEAEESLRRLAADLSLRNAVVDFGKTDYFGSSTLGLLVRLRQELHRRQGRVALCRVSDNERAILEVTGYEDFWPIYPSREEALEALGRCGAAT
jgi:anti-anti-sigma factor